ncbi:hypothetical protein EBR43_06325 [bacterium]|nr:hypothetical protein [bacterium]
MSLINKIEKAVNEMVSAKIMECAEMYGFNAEEAIAKLCVETASKKMWVKKEEKVKKSKVKGMSLMLPFKAEFVKEACCQGIAYNSGLFNQCLNERNEESEYCGACLTEGVESKGMTVTARVSQGVLFKDEKGRGVTSYLTYLKKSKHSVEEARELARSAGVEIEEFLVEEVKKGRPKKEGSASVVEGEKSEKRGRPKKEAKEVKSTQVVDLFASVVSEVVSSADEEEDVESVSSSNMEASNMLEEQNMMSEADKESKKVEKMIKKQEKDAEKAEKEAKKKRLEEEKAAKLAEKEAKRLEKLKQEEERAAKKKALEEARALLEMEKEAKKAAKLAKEQAKAEKAAKASSSSSEVKSSEVVEVVAAPAVAPVVATAEKKEEATAKVQVVEFTHEGVTYWKTSENVLYDPKTQEAKGVWCDKTKTILPAPEESDDELEEEEYDDEEEESDNEDD